MFVTHGIHHITAIAGDAQQNLDFYSGVLGLRMVKGLAEESGRRIEAARPFKSPEDLMRRAALTTRELRFLADCGKKSIRAAVFPSISIIATTMSTLSTKGFLSQPS